MKDLFKKTVGPTHNVFIIYNSSGNSKGMAVAHFARPGDAAVAKQKYHGKIVDSSAFFLYSMLNNVKTND
jgi:THO complex subunit 4